MATTREAQSQPIDARSTAVLIREPDGTTWQDKTTETRSVTADGALYRVVFRGSKVYSYRQDRVLLLHNPKQRPIPRGGRVVVDGRPCSDVTEVLEFRGHGMSYLHLVRSGQGPQVTVHPARVVRILAAHEAAEHAGRGVDADEQQRCADVLRYWRSIVDQLPRNNPLHRCFPDLANVDPESALARIAAGAPAPPLDEDTAIRPIYPFRSNLSQRAAVTAALSHPVSVVQGPPGTGKTQAILNIVASCVAAGGVRVGVVAFSNAAVDNVRDKLADHGIGFVAASLGNQQRQGAFVAQQDVRNRELRQFLATTPRHTEDVDARLATCVARLDVAQRADRELAAARAQHEAYLLERAHFDREARACELPDLARLPLLHKRSGTILDYLAETEAFEERGRRPSVMDRVRRYLRYGSTASLDPSETTTVLRLQQAYYDRKLHELQGEIDRLEREATGLGDLVTEHTLLSRTALDASLHARYGKRPSRTYERDAWQRQAGFGTDYPVLLSSCHSLHKCLPRGGLLDLLVIDEASQLDLLTAARALACARNVVVVGDLRQLPHIATEVSNPGTPPRPELRYESHSLLAAVVGMYGSDIPTTKLREHYRCDPTIIGFCNRKFYDGELIPMGKQTEGRFPMQVWRTAPGEHMRWHRGGGCSNEREVDVIDDEVLTAYVRRRRPDLERRGVGVMAAYRRQVTTLQQRLRDRGECDTVHKYQGREHPVMVMSSVIDAAGQRRKAARFADDPQLINVAVSRAQEEFILVTHHSELPQTRNLRDLIEYIRYQTLDEGVRDSEIVSIFDLLYQDYSPRLEPFRQRLFGRSRYLSERAANTMVHEVLQQERFRGLRHTDEVLLANLFHDTSGFNQAEKRYVDNRARVDFVVYNAVSNRPVLAIEVDGFAFHENSPAHRAKDRLKDSMFRRSGLPLVRLPTTGSNERQRVEAALDEVWTSD